MKKLTLLTTLIAATTLSTGSFALTLTEKCTYNTDPYSEDTDSDGLLDGHEFTGEITLACDDFKDHLGNWLPQWMNGESVIAGTPISLIIEENDTCTLELPNGIDLDLLEKDTDGDGIGDKEELISATNPADSTDYPEKQNLSSLGFTLSTSTPSVGEVVAVTINATNKDLTPSTNQEITLTQLFGDGGITIMPPTTNTSSSGNATFFIQTQTPGEVFLEATSEDIFAYGYFNIQ